MPISVLNSGHGENDTGAVANGLVERDINLVVAKIAKELMEFNGITTYLIGGIADVNKICQEVNKITGANLCHSIHHNAGQGDGYEAIHSVFYGQGTVFAKIMEEEFAKLGQNPHGSGDLIKLSSDGIHDYYGFIRDTDPPAIISEYCFIDSVDYKSIDTYEEQYAEGEAIAKAHCRYYGITYRSPKQSIKEEVKKVKNLVIYLYPEDEGSAMNLARHLQCPVSFYPKQFTSDLFDSVENIYQIGGSAISPKVKLISGNEFDDSTVEYLRFVGKLK